MNPALPRLFASVLLALAAHHPLEARERTCHSPNCQAEDALIKAVVGGDYPGLVEALDDGAFIDARMPSGDTVLCYACRFNRFRSLAETLIRRGADVHARCGRRQESPLLIASSYHNPRLVYELLKKEVDTNARDASGESALHHLAYSYDWDEEMVIGVLFLMMEGADVEARNNSGATPLHYAALRGNQRAVEILLKAGAAASTDDHSGDSPLDIARRLQLHHILPVLETTQEQERSFLYYDLSQSLQGNP